MHTNILSILSSAFAMHPDHAVAYLPIIQRMIEGPLAPALPISEREAAFTAKISSNQDVYVISEYGMEAPPEKAPKNSIAIMSMIGAITKYDQTCGGAGTITKNNIIARALQNENIKGLILLSDSPGGEAFAGKRIADTIASQSKPVYTVVDGLCASAMYHVAAVTKIFATSPMDKIGSIGTLITLADYSAYFESKGIKMLELYATESTEKNTEVREALKGNIKPLQRYLNAINDAFVSDVKNARGTSITDPDAYKGKTFLAADALTAGLIDGICSLGEAIATMQSSFTSNKSIIKNHF